MVESPCKKQCALNSADICCGCGRTREEIGSWMTMSEEGRVRVKKLAERRLAALASQAPTIDSKAAHA
ncbi:MAG: DUF1289 domain-containing protein [Methylocystis sp.]